MSNKNGSRTGIRSMSKTHLAMLNEIQAVWGEMEPMELIEQCITFTWVAVRDVKINGVTDDRTRRAMRKACAVFVERMTPDA